MNTQEQEELLRNLSDKIDRMERRQRAGRIWRLIVFICVVALLAAVVIHVGPKVVAVVDKYNAAVDEIQTISKVMDGVDAESLKDGLKFLETVDFDSMGEKVDQISELTDKLSELDVENMKKVIEDFNNSVAPLMTMFS